MDTLVVFRSRSSAVGVMRILSREGLACTTVATPSRLKLGCGLSVLFPSGNEEKVRAAIVKYGARDFAGFFPTKG